MDNRILIVDDDRTVRILMEHALKGSYQVAAAVSGEEALVFAAQWLPGVVLLDVMLPGMDGHETCRRLRTMRHIENLQIIMVSAAGSREEQYRAMDAGADAYLVKPLDACVLRSAVRLHFRLRDAMSRLVRVESEVLDERRRIEEILVERNREIAATQDVAVFALAKAAESRDEDTGEHLIRVRSYSQILAEELRLRSPYRKQIDAQFLADLYRSSPLHDVGKVGISDKILLKPGRLTPEEFELVKMHTVLGANMLEEVVRYSESGGFLAMAGAIARFHHERFDGSGYLAGLRGEEIPLPARIVALADVFDALTTKRPYKPPYPPEDARQIVLKESGRHFDPVIVEAFEARYDAFLRICGTDRTPAPVVVGALAVGQQALAVPAGAM